MALSTRRAIPENGFKSKFERMDLNLISISNSLPYRCVADLHFEDFPNTVLLFELGCAHPALRVTENIEIIEK